LTNIKAKKLLYQENEADVSKDTGTHAKI